jgi:hypothetical protein
MELLDCLLHNAEELLSGLASGGEEGRGGFRAVLLKEVRFLHRSDRLPGIDLLLSLWRAEMSGPGPPKMAAQLLRIIRFVATTAISVQQQNEGGQLNVTVLLSDIEKLQVSGGLESEAVEALQLEALLLLTDLVKKSGDMPEDHDAEEGETCSQIPISNPTALSSCLLLIDSLNEDTFRILLGNIIRSEEEGSEFSAAQRKREEASREVLRLVMRQSGASLPEGEIDLQLVLALSKGGGDRTRLLDQLPRSMIR